MGSLIDAEPAPAATADLSDESRSASIASEWQGRTSDYPRDCSIAELFASIVASHGQKAAVRCGTRTLTYLELDRAADRVAHKLQAIGVAPDVLVGCIAVRSLEMIVSLMAIFKAGGGYVPIDPDQPAARLTYQLTDTRCVAILGPKGAAATLPPLQGIEIIEVDADQQASDGATPVICAATGGSIAYVMYTSGSTGTPKGVIAEQRSITRLVRNTDYCRLDAGQTWLHYAPLAFDASTLEIWGALLNGGSLVVAPQRASLDELGKLIRDERITSIWLTSGLFSLMVDHRLEDLAGLDQLLAGGDVLSVRHVEKALRGLPKCTVINGYGPTENTTFTCCHVMHPGDNVPNPVPIGRPITNTTAYILDESLKPVPAGTTGELYTGGDGLARGYLNNEQATRERFLPDPFSRRPGARMYRTGDLARWRPDGTIEFVGRADNQVKILGHRIEPGEIETAMSQHPAVRECCVVPLADETGAKRLVAYYRAEAGEINTELRQHLSGRLPRYMMPALLVPMCAMPLNQNGKIDRSALPKPALRPAMTSTVPKGNSVEDTIVGVWKQVIGVERVGLDDNFFDIGGDSLRLVTVHAELQSLLNREIPIVDLFELTTVRALAARLGGREGKSTVLAEAQTRARLQRAAFGARPRSTARGQT